MEAKRTDDYRRFIILKEENLDKFEDLCFEKKLTKEDVILILSSLKLNENFCQE